MLKKVLSPWALAVAGLFLMAACDTGGPEEDRDGSYTAQVSGAFNESLKGSAIFAPGLFVDNGEAGGTVPMFGLQLKAESDEPTLLIAIERIGSDARPGVGTYRAVASSGEIEDEMQDLVVTYTRHQQSPFSFERFDASSGTVQITKSEERRIEGTVQFTGVSAGRQVQVSATFQAVRGFVPE